MEFYTAKWIDAQKLEEEVINRIGGENQYTRLDKYLFESVNNDSYQHISISELKEFIEEELSYPLFGEDIIKVYRTLIDIFLEEGFKEEEDVLIWFCW